jgi:solute carrier family 25 thiamine pyrophosphate transporter 19
MLLLQLKATSQNSSSSSSRTSSGQRVKPTQVQSFTCGLIAGLIAKLVSHPLDVAKKRYQVAGLPRSLKYGARIDQQLAVKPLFSCLAEIYSAEGIRGLWKGSIPSIIKAAPAAAVTFTAYEVLLSWLLAAQQQQQQQQQQRGKHRTAAGSHR